MIVKVLSISTVAAYARLWGRLFPEIKKGKPCKGPFTNDVSIAGEGGG